MRRGMIALLAALSMAALVAGGCASKEAVKAEEPITKVEAKPEPKPEPPKPQPPKPEPPKPEPPKMIEDQGAKASAGSAFETVYFDFDKSDIRQDARDILSKNAEVMLKAKAGVKVLVEGNCDERGSAEYNLALGERRAKAVVKYLTTLGVNPKNLSTISYGKEKPAVQGSNEEAWAKNRRAEFVEQ